MAALASDWLRHFRLLLWNRWTEFNETWQEARSQHPLPSLCFSGRSEKQDGRPGLWLAETFSTSPLKPLNGIQRNLTGSKISTSSSEFVFFGLIGKTRWPPWPLIGRPFSTSKQKCPPWQIPQKGCTLYSGARYVALWASCCDLWPIFLVHLSRRLKCTIVITHCPSSVIRPSLTFHIFDFSSETTEQNSTKLDKKQDLNSLYQVCVYWADRKNKMAAMSSDWLRHFRLLLWNCWTEFNETWQEARSQHPLPSLCFSGWSEKQDGRPSLWLAETFSTSPLEPLKGIQRNLTGSKISMPSTMFLFF